MPSKLKNQLSFSKSFAPNIIPQTKKLMHREAFHFRLTQMKKEYSSQKKRDQNLKQEEKTARKTEAKKSVFKRRTQQADVNAPSCMPKTAIVINTSGIRAVHKANS